MGFSYLSGAYWAQITREERFFCQHLFRLLVNDTENRLLSYINDRARVTFRLDDEWEPAFEVCFYRDFRYFLGDWDQSYHYSPKRTFDLCMLSEKAIIILEAKAQQPFEHDQLESFERDRTAVKEITGVETVWLGGLVSSKYKPKSSILGTLDDPLLTWHELACLYGQDKILQRADELYVSSEIGRWGENNDGGSRCGEELIDLYEKGEILCVGRKGGINGSRFQQDLQSGSWQTRKYETARTDSPPNQNWFRLSDFARSVEANMGGN